MKKIVLAIDSFKGCLTSADANRSAMEAIKAEWPAVQVEPVTVSDGGEGWLDAFHSAIGGEFITLMVRDPMMRYIQADYLVKDDLAVIEIAKASGLTLLTAEERNPMRTTSYGTGQLMADAIRRGCKKLIIGLGGSATSDCGKGMLRAMIDILSPQGNWDDVKQQLDGISITIASDVKNPLCGPNGAAHVFAPQKGATPEMVAQLDEQAKRFAQVSARHFGYDYSEREGAGAAGGLGYALMQYCGATCKSGIDLLLDTIRFDETIADADLVITGEGSADRQTLMGKLPMGILKRGQQHHVPVYLIAGRISDQDALVSAGFAEAQSINPPDLPLEEAIKPEVAKENIRQTVIRIIKF